MAAETARVTPFKPIGCQFRSARCGVWAWEWGRWRSEEVRCGTLLHTVEISHILTAGKSSKTLSPKQLLSTTMWSYQRLNLFWDFRVWNEHPSLAVWLQNHFNFFPSLFSEVRDAAGMISPSKGNHCQAFFVSVSMTSNSSSLFLFSYVLRLPCPLLRMSVRLQKGNIWRWTLVSE